MHGCYVGIAGVERLRVDKICLWYGRAFIPGTAWSSFQFKGFWMQKTEAKLYLHIKINGLKYKIGTDVNNMW